MDPIERQTDEEADRLFAAWKISEEGRQQKQQEEWEKREASRQKLLSEFKTEVVTLIGDLVESLEMGFYGNAEAGFFASSEKIPGLRIMIQKRKKFLFSIPGFSQWIVTRPTIKEKDGEITTCYADKIYVEPRHLREKVIEAYTSLKLVVKVHYPEKYSRLYPERSKNPA